MSHLSRLCQGLAALLQIAVLAAEALAAESIGGPVSVVAYLPEWRFEGANYERISEHVTHLLLFSLEPSGSGGIIARDRLPRASLLEEARRATRKHGTELLLCFGGNGRSAGFSKMVSSRKRRARFLELLASLLRELDLDGVDYNWEYPGYSFGSGYMPDEQVEKDYSGLRRLVKETKAMFRETKIRGSVTLAYYPDGRQENLIRKHGIDKYVDLMHMMTYDQNGEHHSTYDYAVKSARQGASLLSAGQLTLGLPFYGRNSQTGDWTTYEDIILKNYPLAADIDVVKAPGSATLGFNGVDTIRRKTAVALELGLGGVMIWEVGQDCRLEPVEHGSKTHVRTCPSDESSLLLAISAALREAGRTRVRNKKLILEQAALRDRDEP